MGWTSKLHLRLEDGQPLVAQLPNEEIEGVEAGQHLFANLRNPKVFTDDRDSQDLDQEAAAVDESSNGDGEGSSRIPLIGSLRK